MKTILVAVLGLMCGAGAILAYDAVMEGVVVEIPGAISAPGPAFSDPVALPDRIIIPKIGVDAHIKPVGLDKNGDMATPGNATDVGWYQGGPRPGVAGSAVIDGHLSTKYVAQAVFHRLRELQSGDEVQIRTVEGQTMAFRVVKVREYSESASTTEVFDFSGSVSRLNLISCAGDWDPAKKTYADRIVVFAERVN